MKSKNQFTQETVAGLFVIVGLVILTYMTINLGNISLFGDPALILTARFSTVTGLRANNPVEIHGIEVGQVADLSIDQNLQMAVATLKIKKEIEIYSDAIATIKTAGLIGDKFINIDPGGSGTLLKSGDVIINTESPADLGDLIGKYAFGSMDSKNSNGESRKSGTDTIENTGEGLNLDLNLDE